jgi:hypothetical protein
MTGDRRADDVAIQAMLTARAARAEAFRFDPASIVAAAGPRARRLPPGAGFFGRAPVAASAIAAAIVVAVFVGSPLVGQPAASQSPVGSGPTIAASPSGLAPTASSSPVAPAAAMRVLAPAEAGELIRSQSANLAGTLIAVEGRLELRDLQRCRSVKPCGPTVLADAGSGFIVQPVGDIGPGPWAGSGPVVGTLVLRLSAAIENGVHIVEFVGTLTTPPNGGPAWFVQDLLEGAAHVDGAYAAVDGWLVRTPYHLCGSNPRNPVVVYGCPTDDYLTEDQFQPLQADGSTIGPLASIDLSSGSYDRWAPDPAPAGPEGRGVEPRHAIYLLWLVSDGCGPNADCALPPPRWRIVGRFDPLPGPVEPAPSPSTVPPSADAFHTVAELVTDPMSFINQDVTVDGWLVATPPLRCVGSCEFDWITDVAFEPWVSDGQTGSTIAPKVGIRVQDGAYAAFADRPATDANVWPTPRFGRYVVRGTVHDACELLPPAPTDSPTCAGPAIVLWEVVERLPDRSVPSASERTTVFPRRCPPGGACQ